MIVNLFDNMGGPTLQNPDFFLNDHCHPTDIGYFHIANVVAEVLSLPLYPFEVSEDSTEKI